MVINNFSSGLIREQQKNKYDSRFESTTCNSGYSIPDLKKISNAFDINYYNVSIESDSSKLNRIFKEVEPALIEIVIDEDVYGIPYLPKGRPFQDLEPKIDRELYNMLERM
jgi:acetolactate synthase-1/2/3 large subunit